ncbi:MAG: hypothetical protein H6741_11880 [Alphaproteobacteria bacterium]|nr:hypothetical protein [Alphaproteobacteria bacterium]MCB9793411.1 hypothetical protein [Alphaproteobacteria bacterium]
MRQDEIELRFRCELRWEALEGEGAERWCRRCERSVTDLSALSEAEARAQLADGQERCVRYRVRPDQRLVHRPRVGLAALLGLLIGGPAQAQSGAFVFGDEEVDFIGGAVHKPQLAILPAPVDAGLPPEILIALDVITADPPPRWALRARVERLRARWILKGGRVHVAD